MPLIADKKSGTLFKRPSRETNLLPLDRASDRENRFVA